MPVRDVQAHLKEIYGVDVGHDLISAVTALDNYLKPPPYTEKMTGSCLA